MLISQQARADIPVNHDFHPERVPNHQEWSSYSTTVTLSSSERQEHMFLLKRPDHMRCGHASIPRFPTLVGMLYANPPYGSGGRICQSALRIGRAGMPIRRYCAFKLMPHVDCAA